MTRQQPRVPSERIILTACTLVGIAGMVSLLLAAMAGTSRPRVVPLLLLGTALLVVQARPHLQIQKLSSMAAIQLDELLMVPMLAFLSPIEVVASCTLALAATQAIQRKPLVKLVFNAGQISVAAGVATMVDHVLRRSTGAAGAAMIAAIAFSVVSALLVSAVIAYVSDQGYAGTVLGDLRPRAAALVSSLCLGGIVVLAYRTAPWAAALLVVPAALLQRTYNLALHANEQRKRTKAMYDAAAGIRASLDSSRVLGALTDAAAALLGARKARVVGSSEPPTPGALRSELNEELVLEVSERVGGKWEDYDRDTLQGLAHVATGALRNASLFEHLEAITHAQEEGVVAVDADGRVSFANPAAAVMLGRQDLMGSHVDEVLRLERREPNGRVEAVGSLVERCKRDDDALLVRADGVLVPVGFTANPVSAGETSDGTVVVLRDITVRKAFEEKLLHQAFHDPLTGLPNRRLFKDRLSHAMARAERSSAIQGVIMFDLDRFKLVNDSLGHTVGDHLLVALAERLEKVLRPQDTLARLGGDEFVILVEDIPTSEALAALAGRLLDAVAEPFNVGGKQLFAAISAGIADSSNPAAADDLMAAADAALYRAKASGKGRYEIFKTENALEASAKLELEARLRRAVERNEFELHYQPIVRAMSGEPIGAEALLRWNSPEGRVSPADFIPLAEETGLIWPIGTWVLNSAARQAKQWADTFGTAPSISVNLSARQFGRPQIVDEVAAVLRETGVDPGCLSLEITESMVMEDTESTRVKLAALRGLGVKISIDDFGVGYSSLSYLKQFPVDTVKIDKTFVDGMLTEPVDAEIVAAIVRIGEAKGFATVAEGVEMEEQARALLSLGCTSIQGFLYSKPLPAEEFEVYWAGHHMTALDVGPGAASAGRRENATGAA